MLQRRMFKTLEGLFQEIQTYARQLHPEATLHYFSKPNGLEIYKENVHEEEALHYLIRQRGNA